VLTPEEFVIAGDFLVHHCPTWQWHSGDRSKTKPYLPAEKQYLLTRSGNVNLCCCFVVVCPTAAWNPGGSVIF